MARLFSEERSEVLRERGAAPEWAPARDRLRTECAALLEGAPVPPAEPAGFYHDFFCPAHAVQLVFDPGSPGAHRCPVDGRVFAGEPYDAAWRWFVNNRLSSAAYRLALRWTAEADATCRERAVRILADYAGRYPGYEPAPSRPRGRGKATFQSLDEAVWLIPLARAYDLLRQSLDGQTRRLVEEDLLRPAAEFILGEKYYRIHNIECWHNAAIAAVGACLEVEEWLHLATEAEFGFEHQLAAGVRDDGLWWEGSSSYHFYALAALTTQAQLLEERSLWRSERLARMFRTPVELAYPDLRQPATNDCWFSSSLAGQVCHGVPEAAALYELAHGWYGDALFAGVLAENYRSRRRDSLEALLYGRQLPAQGGPVELSPATSCEPSGLACFRSRRGDYLLLKYGPHGGGHGHPDKLSVALCAGGVPLSPDLGTPGYGIDLNDTWYRQTLSHNTVVVDGRSQPAAAGRLLAFDPGPEDYAVADAAVYWAEGAYAGVSMRRLVLWREDYFVDLFLVDGDRERQIDWVFRVAGQRRKQRGIGGLEDAQLEGDGYRHVSGARGGVVHGAASLQWQTAGGHFDLFLPEEEGELIVGRVPANPASEESDLLLRRRRAQQVAFLAVGHAWKGASQVTEVERVVAPPEVRAFRVRVGGQVHQWLIGPPDRIGQVAAGEADLVLKYGL